MKRKILLLVALLFSLTMYAQETPQQKSIREKELAAKQKKANQRAEDSVTMDLQNKLEELYARDSADHGSLESRDLQVQIQKRIYDYRKANKHNYLPDEVKIQKKRVDDAIAYYNDAVAVDEQRKEAAEKRRREAEWAARQQELKQKIQEKIEK